MNAERRKAIAEIVKTLNGPVQEDKIITGYWPKPIPERRFDWSAIRNGYEPGCPIGYGATEAEAIAELKALEEENE